MFSLINNIIVVHKSLCPNSRNVWDMFLRDGISVWDGSTSIRFYRSLCFPNVHFFLIEMQKSKPTEGHNFHLFEQVLSFFLPVHYFCCFICLYFIFPCTELAVKFLLIQIGTIIEKFFLAVLFFWRKVVHLLFFTKNEKNGSYNIIICSGLLIFCNVAISHGC